MIQIAFMKCNLLACNTSHNWWSETDPGAIWTEPVLLYKTRTELTVKGTIIGT